MSAPHSWRCLLWSDRARPPLAAHAAGRRILGGAGDGGHQFVVGGVGGKHAIVAPKPENDDAISNGQNVLHVVADHYDPEATVAHPLDEVQDLSGLRHS